jgi:hypothetical protein
MFMSRLSAKTFFCMALLLGTNAAMAESSGQAEDWNYGIEAYLWGANIDTTSPDGSSNEIRFTDLAKDLEFGFMLAAAVRREKWVLITDVIYLDIEDDIEEEVEPGVELKSLGLEGWIVNPVVGYQALKTDTLTLEVLGGARYFWIEVPLDVRFNAPNPPGQEKSSESSSIWDGTVGMRARWDFAHNWYAVGHVDVGTGDSDHTTQALLSVGYKFNKFYGVFGYRYLDWSLDDDAPLQDVNLSGFMAGIKFLF